MNKMVFLFDILLFLYIVAVSGSETERHHQTVHTISTVCDDLLYLKPEACCTLNQLIDTQTFSGGGNLTLRFLPGKHFLDQTLIISGYEHVHLTSKDSTIIVHGHSVIKLKEIDHVNIEFLSFTQQNENPTNQNVNQVSMTLEMIKNVRLGFSFFRHFKSISRIIVIHRCENVVVEKVIFEFNLGQALYIDSLYVRVVDSKFNNNRNGALNISSDYLELTNSKFKDNSSPIGGAVQLNSNSTAVLNCQFVNNSADYGGALSICNSTKVNISRSAFSSNSAGCGGAVAIESSDVTFTDCVFMGNMAIIDYSYDKEGHMSDEILMENLNLSYYGFKHNNSIIGGGGIFIWSGNVNIFNTSFMSNAAVSLRGKLSFSQHLHSDITGNAGGGAIIIYSGGLLVCNCVLANNTSPDFGGGGIHIGYTLFTPRLLATSVNVVINSTKFIQNSGGFGGAIFLGFGQVSVLKSQLLSNKAVIVGGAIMSSGGNIFVIQSQVIDNTGSDGGAISSGGSLNVQDSVLAHNKADFGGGALVIKKHGIISNTTIMHNVAKGNHGGAILLAGYKLNISYSSLTNNTAFQSGGALWINNGKVLISHSSLTHNTAVQGAVLYAQKQYSNVSMDNCYIAFNKEGSINGGIIYIYQSFLMFGGVMMIENNNGSIYALFTQLVINGNSTFINNSGELGGAISAVQSEVYINEHGFLSICNNTAVSGGGMYLKGSSVYAYSPIKMCCNKAQNGGGIYAFLSTIKFNAFELSDMYNTLIFNNVAQNGGGMSVIASTIELLRSYVDIKSNVAKHDGGGIYLGQNSKIYILKLDIEYGLTAYKVKLTISDNLASRGGGILVADETEVGGLCRALPGSQDPTLSECFIQTLYLYDTTNVQVSQYNVLNTIMSNNKANASGANIYGGLLDRCTVDPLTPYHHLTGWEYLQKTVNFNSSKSITSDPVRVVLCSNSFLQISILKGGEFKVPVMAVDQIGNPVSAIVLNSVITKSGVGRLKEGQTEQSISAHCTNLTFNVFSADDEAQLLLFARGPCMNSGISKVLVNISFLPCICPIGFQSSQSSVECQCTCDAKLKKFRLTSEDCFYEDGTIQLQEDIWIGVVNATNRTYYVDSSCPFDYCTQRPVNVSLNHPDEIDKQCAFNRSGVLCGECDYGLSLVLATSKCKECSNIFLLLIFPFALAGIILVGFIFLVHMTVANGAINSLIFYANIVAANRAAFIPFNNFLTVFISWVNLDLGIEACLYDGMTSQAKILLQLVFPAYLFLLIFLIILLCKHFRFFANLLSSRNPVAALGTLILLSYSKLLRFIIAGLQYRILSYPSSRYIIVWLYDGNVKYFSVNHIPAFVAATLILVAGTLFTIFMFFGQWFPLCSKWTIMKWTKNTKYIGFMDVYHAPFTPKHRYWVGLLLLALISHNVIVAIAPNTSLPVLSAGCISVGLLVIKLISSKIYKSKFNSHLETLFLLNIATLCYGTSYVQDLNLELVALSSVSLGMAFILFIVMFMYHLLGFSLKQISTPVLWISIKNSFKKCWQNVETENEADENILLREEVHSPIDREFEHYEREDSPIEEIDYITPPIIRPATKPNQLRLSYMDDLAPVTDDDYRQSTPSHYQPVVTHTQFSVVNNELLVHN